MVQLNCYAFVARSNFGLELAISYLFIFAIKLYAVTLQPF